MYEPYGHIHCNVTILATHEQKVLRYGLIFASKDLPEIYGGPTCLPLSFETEVD
jgi:hypothetical protein